VSLVSIVNEALDLCSADTITSLTENSLNAERANRFVTSVRQQLLAGYPWTFAKTKVALAALSDNDRENEWGYAYGRPADCVRMIGVGPEVIYRPDVLVRFQWVMDGDTIYSDTTPAYAYYIRDVTDPSRFTPGFRTAYVSALAARLVLPITKDIRRAADLRNVARQDFIVGAAQNANEAENQYEFVSSYDIARQSGSVETYVAADEA